MLATAGILFFAPLLLAPPQDGDGDAAIRSDAAFARALTTELGFANLAEHVLDGALDQASTPADKGLVLLTRCDVRKLAAQRANDPLERLAALKDAGHAYAEFLDTDPTGGLLNQADLNFAEVAFQYGLALKTHLEIEKPTGDDRAALVNEAVGLFQKALLRVNEMLARFRALDSEEREARRFALFYPGLFYRANIYFSWSLLFPPESLERNQNTDKALELLESFSLEVGEGSVAGLMGYKTMADVYVAQGNGEYALDFYTYVIENGIPEGADSLDPAEVDRRQEIMQDAYQGWMTMLVEAGQITDAHRLGETFQTWVEDEVVLYSQSGYRMLLGLARVFILQSRYGDAIQLAELVSRENEKSILQLEAFRVMGEAVAAAPPDMEIDLGVLYSAAFGAWGEKKYEDAIQGFKLLLSRMETNTRQADEYGPQTYYWLGRAWAAQGRRLEAAVTFQAGIDLYPDDEDNAEKSAKAWLTLAEGFRQVAPGDPILERFYNDALDAVSNLGGTAPDKVAWRAAEADYRSAKQAQRAARGKAADAPEGRAVVQAFDKAKASYARIPQGSNYFEKAMVQRGLCEFNKIAWQPAAADRAFQIFDEYLEVFQADPANTPTEPSGKKNRKEAAASADFYRGRILVADVRAGDTGACRKLLELYEGFYENHPEQPDYAAATMADRVLAFLGLGQTDQAVAEFEALVAANLNKQLESVAAFRIYSYYDTLAAETTGEEHRSSLRLAADYLHTYNAYSSKPDWRNLNQEARLRLELKEFANATDLFERILRTSANDPTFSEDNRFFVQMDLIESYLAQNLTGKAMPLVDTLLEDPDNQRNPQVMQASVKILIGYPMVRENRVVIIPGQASTEAYERAETLITDSSSGLLAIAEYEAGQKDVNKYAYTPYWDAKLMQAFLLYQWGQIDSTRSGGHKRLIGSLRNLAPDLGRGVAGEDMAQILDWLERQ